jgi:hypothetical protein
MKSKSWVIRNLNKKVAIGLVATLVILAAALYVVHTEARADETSKTITLQAEQLQTLSKRIGDYTYSPHSLGECLNNAANEYTNYIRANGEVSVAPDRDKGYSLASDEWKRADDKLQSDKGNCEALFGKE